MYKNTLERDDTLPTMLRDIQELPMNLVSLQMIMAQFKFKFDSS